MAYLDDPVFCAGRHQPYLHVAFKPPVHDAEVYDDAFVSVVLAVEYEGPERRVRVAFWGGDVGYYPLEHVFYAYPALCGDFGGVFGWYADYVFDFLFNALRLCGGEVYLVHDRQYFEVVVEGQVCVRERLRFYALRCVDDEYRAFACGKRA
jgi:hypothetical protein